MLSISKKKQYLKTNEELSGMLVAKNAPIRNYSTSTRNSRISYKSKHQQSQNQSEDKGVTSRTYSVSEATELPKINNPTKVIVRRPSMIPRPKQQLRKLIHVQTSPTNLEPERKQSNLDSIPYRQLEFNIEAEEVYILYKGFRNLNSLNKICILSYNLVFGENINFAQNNPIKPLNYKQLIMKLKSESILVLLMNPNQKLNTLQSSQFDWFDCIFQIKTYHPKELLSHELNKFNLWINVDNLQKQFKIHQKINQYYFLDVIQIEQITPNIEQDNLISKILLIDDETIKLFHLFVKQPVNLQILSQKMLEIFKNNSVNGLQQFQIEDQIKNAAQELNQIQIKIKEMKYVEELKQKTKNHFKKINQNQVTPSPEQRAEKYIQLNKARMRNQMVEYMKSNQKIKISNLHFLIGDTIMRNIEMFRNHENDKFYRNSETVQLIEHIIKNNMPNFQINRSKANYAFYCL